MRLLVFLCLFSMGCMNKVEVPNKVENCFKDPVTGACTNHADITVTHVITIELPTIFTDTCKKTWNDVDFPDQTVRDVGYNKCVTDYINQLMNLVKGLNPATLPNVIVPTALPTAIPGV